MDRKKCKSIIKNVSRLLLAQILEEEIEREKKLWVRKWLARSTYDCSALLLKELHAEDSAKYRACLRMSPECFDTLHDVQRLDTLMRDAIPSRIKLETAVILSNWKKLQKFLNFIKFLLVGRS
jgi:hypothetical protein